MKNVAVDPSAATVMMKVAAYFLEV